MKEIKSNILICVIIFCTNSLLVKTEKENIDTSVESQGEEYLDFIDFAANCGYEAESYDIVTEDGYILKLHHIPGHKTRPVFLMHGQGETSDAVILREEKSLAIALAQNGYDVWAGNYRGNAYTRRHVTLDPDVDKKFWDFSFHEIAIYDVPAMIDFIYEKCDHQPINTIGYSEGNTLFFALGAWKPEYNNKINLCIALAPICYLDHARGPMRLIPAIEPIISPVMEKRGVEEVFARGSSQNTLNEIVCGLGKLGYELCNKLGYSALFGFDPDQLEPEFFPKVIKYFIAGTSRKNFFHITQSARTKRFSLYDYGIVKNLEIYNSELPPAYDLSKAVMKIALIYGPNDNVATIKNTEKLRNELPNVVEMFEVPRNWNHIDFILARDGPKYLYPQIVRMLEKYD